MVQEATRKETLRIAAGTGIGVVLMVIAFAVLHAFIPEHVPFDYKVITGGVGGGAVAVLNFFLMGLTVQQIAKETDDKRAYQRMKVSYTQRMLLQIIWIILALALPGVNGVAGVIPLLFPGLTIKIYYIFIGKSSSKQAAEEQTAVDADSQDDSAVSEERGDSE